MDFDAAVGKLERDHSSLRKSRKSRDALTRNAKREAERRKRQYEKKAAEKALKQQQLDYVTSYWNGNERALGTVRSLGQPKAQEQEASHSSSSLKLSPTSIHGDGDKIALPPLVLESLSNREGGMLGGDGSPLFFRVGLLNPNYASFPSGPLLKDMMEKHIPNKEDVDDVDDDCMQDNATAAFMEEMSHKYISYTHCTVVEFTQEDGCVGLPQSIAKALLDKGRRRVCEDAVVVPVKRTVDPAGAAASVVAIPSDTSSAMDVDEQDAAMEEEESGASKTPGHLAWGAFDVPDMDVEVTMVTLPKGKACTLVPSLAALRNGFNNLKDVKVVLEQSLIRTRATLSVNDEIHCWHRGVKFDLRVSSVTPNDYGVVSCINTDIEVDIGSPDLEGDGITRSVPMKEQTDKVAGKTPAFSGGYTLKDVSTTTSSSSAASSVPKKANTPASPIVLPPEPPSDQKEGVCTILIRGDGTTGKRRFDITTTKMNDLFNFAAQVCSTPETQNNIASNEEFQLVTRFPRKVYTCSEHSLLEEGIKAGQEMLIVERH
eukprot:CAMPEP_0195530104 /NCGR_PEP_ID=MMETSP0794_2-20130614/32867_1 /TAXON_ID=515487 /ORGANISM="Stephanopyxis turris, Strain CCMP 815" /LENGTH=543 /DNA_ID=CAMNT_0040661527 /DNA_START=154 /DNA_END=1788 /DNA_ORIENTATION=-